jgi:hypothetical protein
MLAIVGGAMLVVACGSASPFPTGVAASAGSSAVLTPAVAAPCDKTAKAFDAAKIDLTGAWSADDDGIYYLRQVGSIVWWNGMSGRSGTPERLGREWNNVARGEIKGVSVLVDWADVPRGQIQDGGTMTLKIEDDGTGNVSIVKVSETSGDFGNTSWTPCKPA